MKAPVIRGVIDRRILVNYRVDPVILQKLLPAPFRPKLVKGSGVAGICLIRLKYIRPRFSPFTWGVSSENAAYRLAVEWEENGKTLEGVYIPRRVTSSRINSLAGGRLFPGVQQHGSFAIKEQDDDYHFCLSDGDATPDVLPELLVEARACPEMTPSGLFNSLKEASAFFQQGAVGYSPKRSNGEMEGIELCTCNWKLEPLAVARVSSKYFEDRAMFPTGTIELDSAWLMRKIDHEWRQRTLAPLLVS